MRKVLAVVTLCLGVVIWEHVGRVHQWPLRPSVPLEIVAQKCEYVWHQLGVLVGYLGGIWEWLYRYLLDHLHEVLITVEFLGRLLGRIVLSPLQFIWGYTETLRSYLYSRVVVMGNMISLGLVVGGLLYWHWQPQWNDFFATKTHPTSRTSISRTTVAALPAELAAIAAEDNTPRRRNIRAFARGE